MALRASALTVPKERRTRKKEGDGKKNSKEIEIKTPGLREKKGKKTVEERGPMGQRRKKKDF